MSVKISDLTTLASQLQSADYIPIVRSGVTYKYAPFGYVVKNSGNETVAGVKTFSSSPVVPTPTTDMQASTKKYVDDNIDALGVGDPNGVATLDSNGKVPTTQMPPIAISNTSVVVSEAAMLALTAETGDLAKRTDYTPAKTFILAAEPASTLSNWVEITVSTDPNTPTSDQKAALAGTSGTPSSTNPYATDASLIPLEALKEYDPTYPYDLNETCFYLGIPYKSLSVGNTGHNPVTDAAFWEATGGGTSSSESGITFTNGQLERNVTDYNPYADTASTTPVDGTGGTPTITFTFNSTSPLVGLGDAILTKPATNCQGQGVSHDFTIDRGKVQSTVQVSFEYQTGALYTDGDIGIFVYDITNATLIPLSIQSLPASLTPSKYLGTFIPSTSTQYRLILHITSTNASTYTFEIDDIVVSQKQVAIGAVISNPVKFPMVIAGDTNPAKSTSSLEKSFWSRCGAKLVVDYDYYHTNPGSAGAGMYRYTLPFPIDLTKHSVGQVVGSASVSNNGVDTGATTLLGDVMVLSATTVALRLINPVSSESITAYHGSGLLSFSSSVLRIRFTMSVYCSQWTSNINLTSDFTEYASNSNTANATESAYVPENNVLGAGGSSVPLLSVATGSANRYVQFQRQYSPTDRFEVEFSDGNGWVPASQRVGSWNVQKNYYYGVKAYGQPDLKTVCVEWGSGGYDPSGISSFGTAGFNSWAGLSTWRWRVRKVSNGNMAETRNDFITATTGERIHKKILRGTTSATAPGTVSISHGLDVSKIIGFTGGIYCAGASQFLPFGMRSNLSDDANCVTAYVASTAFLVINTPGLSASYRGTPFVITVEYIE
jgi:hypothetical protein